jgi:hypothetical protein
MKLKLVIVTLTIFASLTALHYAGRYAEKQPSKLDACRTMVLAETRKNQQFVDALAPVGFHEALGAK